MDNGADLGTLAALVEMARDSMRELEERMARIEAKLQCLVDHLTAGRAAA